MGSVGRGGQPPCPTSNQKIWTTTLSEHPVSVKPSDPLFDPSVALTVVKPTGTPVNTTSPLASVVPDKAPIVTLAPTAGPLPSPWITETLRVVTTGVLWSVALYVPPLNTRVDVPFPHGLVRVTVAEIPAGWAANETPWASVWPDAVGAPLSRRS